LPTSPRNRKGTPRFIVYEQELSRRYPGEQDRMFSFEI
jgi:hypothetical protein